MPAPVEYHTTRPLYAISLRLASVALFSVMFTSVKLASERGAHLLETLFYRQFFALIVVTAILVAGPGLASVRTERPGAHVLRTAIGTFGMVLFFASVMLLPLAEATTVGFTVPIFAAILSAIILREPTGIHRWSAIALGFAGVLIVMQPGGHANVPVMGFAIGIAAALNAAFVNIMIRQLARTESALTIVFWFSALSTPILAIGLFLFGRVHDPVTWGLLAATGVCGGLAQVLMTSSLRWAPVSLVLPMDYSSLIWSTLFGWILWNVLPGPTTWIGAMLIVASSLYIAWRERVKQRDSSTRTLTPD